MAPKIESVLDALSRGAKRAIVCGAGGDALADFVTAYDAYVERIPWRPTH
jgi:hypothetical protein